MGSAKLPPSTRTSDKLQQPAPRASEAAATTAETFSTGAATRGPAADGNLPPRQHAHGNSLSSRLIQRKADPGNDSLSLPEGLQPALGRSGPGHPLDASTRNAMQSRFADDFDDIRVHTDAH